MKENFEVTRLEPRTFLVPWQVSKRLVISQDDEYAISRISTARRKFQSVIIGVVASWRVEPKVQEHLPYSVKCFWSKVFGCFVTRGCFCHSVGLIEIQHDVSTTWRRSDDVPTTF